MKYCAFCGPNGPLPHLLVNPRSDEYHVECPRCEAQTVAFNNDTDVIAAWGRGEAVRPDAAIKALPDPRKCHWPDERNCHPCFCGKSTHPEAHEPAKRIHGMSDEDTAAHYSRS